ncbi:hypothetical protein GCM10010123_33330 [Pilimelia anulata]|uniref:Uncharacterized protein n=2 Tax=Pilimelia anulata TaxID=53371 RepID=A0A8J3BDN0_9ACTN|nr:hypothetical protein GCM10010123_33330 [Pilimelia anulata]
MAALGAVLVAGGLVLAGCGGDDEPAAGNGPGGDRGRGGAFTAYVNCLRDNGVVLQLPSGRPGRGDGQGRPGGEGQGRPGEGRPGDGPGGPGGPSGDGQGRPGGDGQERPGDGPGGPGRRPGGPFRKPDSVDQATWDKAQQACASVRPTLRPGGGRGGPGSAYRNCLRDQGVTSRNPDEADPTVARALAKCKALRPSPAPTG